MRSLLLAVALAASTASAQQPTWKVGVASQVITPQKSVWLAGYSSRTKPPTGKAQDLFAKALAFEDERGTRAVIVTLDLIGIGRKMRDDIAREVQSQFKLPASALLFNASHTHSGPVMRGRPSVLYYLTPEQWEDIETNLRDLHKKLVKLVGAALADLQPAQLGYRHARAGFAMNRRLPTDKGYQNSPYPDGPVDHEVPVLRVEDPKGKLRAILFGYACHNTVLALDFYCGDYAGYAQEHLQELHPGVTASFLMGCGGDQNPYPRSTLDLAKFHGRTLATAVNAALLPKARPVNGPLNTAFEDVTLEFVALTRAELDELSRSKNVYDQRRSKVLLAELEKNGKLKTDYPFPVQVLQFGKDLTIVALAGETVVDYSLRLKKEITGNPVWVAGYSNDVFGYVPSVRVLKEGGYEAGDAFRYSEKPGRLAESVEERIVGKVKELVERVRK